MSGFQHDIAGGQGNLIATSVQSPNFATGVSGWQIRKDGSAEFNNLTIRGTFDGTDFVINSSGAFFYSPSPGAGNLVASIAPAAGTDAFGNAYVAGVVSYLPAFGSYVQMHNGAVIFHETSTFNDAEVSAASTFLQLTSPIATGSDLPGLFQLFGTASAGAVPAFGVTAPLNAFDPSGSLAAETWHSLGSPSATGYTVNFGRYRLTPSGEAEIDIQLLANAGGGTAGIYTFANTLPAAYRFAGSTSRSNPLSFNGTITTATNQPNALIDGASTGNPGRVRIQIPGLPAGTVLGATFTVPLS